MLGVLGLVILMALKNEQTNTIKKAEWLLGTWQNKTPKGSIYETWSNENDFTFTGMSYMIKENDTMVFENIRLVQEPDGLYYVPVVKNQNDGLPVWFMASAILDNKLVFENPQHDFPQTISYTKITADSLVAEISGSRNGQIRKQTFPMKKLK